MKKKKENLICVQEEMKKKVDDDEKQLRFCKRGPYSSPIENHFIFYFYLFLNLLFGTFDECTCNDGSHG